MELHSQQRGCHKHRHCSLARSGACFMALYVGHLAAVRESCSDAGLSRSTTAVAATAQQLGGTRTGGRGSSAL
jgi:hypothetical protein